MKKNLATLASVLAIGTALSVPALASAGDKRHHPKPQPPSMTLAQILLADSAKDDADGFDRNWYDYDIVTQAVLQYPDLVAAASNPDLDLTVFLPNDRAFRKLVKDLTGQRLHTEAAVFGAVAGLGPDTVKTVLTYHIILGTAISYEAALKSDGAALTTLQGGTFTVDVKGRYWRGTVRLVDNDPDARDAKVVAPNLGGEATNGFAHGISRVLRPVNL